MHAGVSGKWTNALEKACQKEEPLAQVLADTLVGSLTARSAAACENT
jgi:hypothetical protein